MQTLTVFNSQSYWEFLQAILEKPELSILVNSSSPKTFPSQRSVWTNNVRRLFNYLARLSLQSRHTLPFHTTFYEIDVSFFRYIFLKLNVWRYFSIFVHQFFIFVLQSAFFLPYFPSSSPYIMLCQIYGIYYTHLFTKQRAAFEKW